MSADTEGLPRRTTRTSRRYRDACTRLGKRVRRLRHEKELTLEAAAERMHIDFKHLQKIEAGSLNVTVLTLVRVATGLGVDLSELFKV